MSLRRVAPALLAALVLTGCGGKSADLFEVQRSGADRNANVDLVVNDGGTVSCDHRASKARPGRQLRAARELARQLESQAALSIELPPAENSVLRYVVRTSNGRVAFSDTSPNRPPAFDRLAAFSKDVIEGVCGIER
ncbi:MAG: hypothetical protein ACR2NB_12465 [Solirubrobacteraceae bacterium]